MFRYAKRLLIGVALLLAVGAPAKADYYTYSVSIVGGDPSTGALTLNPDASSNAVGAGLHITPFVSSQSYSATAAANSIGILTAGTTNFSPIGQAPNLTNLGPATFTGSNSNLDLQVTLFYHLTNGNVLGQATQDVLATFKNTQYGNTSNFFNIWNFAANGPLPTWTIGGQSFTGLSLTFSGGSGTGVGDLVLAPGGGNGHTASFTPEPSSLLLSFMGLTLAGAAVWRKRRQNLAIALA